MPECYGISPYAFCAGDPVRYVDRDGGVIETALDVVSLTMGVKSFVSNVKAGNTRGAIWDGVGIVADAAAIVAPFVPGGAGAAIKAARAADKGGDILKAVDTGADAVKAANKVDDAARTARMKKLRETAKIGQEAHRQIERELKEKHGASTEVKVDLDNNKSVRKDARMPDGTYVIIKPDTPSGRAAAKKREILMQSKGKTKTIYYDPSNPAYQPGSPTYIGPKMM